MGEKVAKSDFSDPNGFSQIPFLGFNNGWKKKLVEREPFFKGAMNIAQKAQREPGKPNAIWSYLLMVQKSHLLDV